MAHEHGSAGSNAEALSDVRVAPLQALYLVW